jgi:gliding motility-associated-like protein
MYCATLIATDENGCTSNVTNCVDIGPAFSFYIPSAFSPNGDGKNDVFMAKGDYVKNFEMYIFDRWGMQIFYSNNINIGWNGTVKGSSTICQEDTYVYKINVTDSQNNSHSYIGNVNLLK